MRSLVSLFLPLFCEVDLMTNNAWFDVGDLMMPNRLHMVPGIERTMLITVVNLCLLVLRVRSKVRLSMVLHGSRIMKAPGIL